MVDDEELRAKLAKVQALFRDAGSPGERAAAEAAMDRLHDRVGTQDGDREPEVELQYSLPDMWSVRLFLAVCRKHGVRPSTGWCGRSSAGCTPNSKSTSRMSPIT